MSTAPEPFPRTKLITADDLLRELGEMPATPAVTDRLLSVLEALVKKDVARTISAPSTASPQLPENFSVRGWLSPGQELRVRGERNKSRRDSGQPAPAPAPSSEPSLVPQAIQAKIAQLEAAKLGFKNVLGFNTEFANNTTNDSEHIAIARNAIIELHEQIRLTQAEIDMHQASLNPSS